MSILDPDPASNSPKSGEAAFPQLTLLHETVIGHPWKRGQEQTGTGLCIFANSALFRPPAPDSHRASSRQSHDTSRWRGGPPHPPRRLPTRKGRSQCRRAPFLPLSVVSRHDHPTPESTGLPPSVPLTPRDELPASDTTTARSARVIRPLLTPNRHAVLAHVP